MQAVMSTRFAAPAKATAQRRSSVVVCAQQQQVEAVPRRAALALAAAAVLGLATEAAEAAQPAPKNSSIASMEGYNMEGTKKQGVSPKRKRAVLDKLRKQSGLQ